MRVGRSTRARKVYEITPHGEEVFEQLLESADDQGRDPRGFSLRLAFARHLTPQARVRLLEKRRGQLIDRLQRGEWSMRRRTRPMDEYEHSIAEHAQETIANDLARVERLLDRERAALDRSVQRHDGAGTRRAPVRRWRRRRTSAESRPRRSGIRLLEHKAKAMRPRERS